MLQRIYVIWWDVLINVLTASVLMPRELRYVAYKIAGLNVQTRAINPRCYFGGNQISIGQGTFINYNCYFDNTSPISIGNNCDIAMEVIFCTSTHEMGTKQRRAGKSTGKPIEVKDGCWIGARATIMPGVTIGEGCIIASGSVVNKDCEPNGMYAGVPARRIKDM